MATTRCCSSGRNSLPVCWRAAENIALATCSSLRSPRLNARRPSSTSGTVSQSKTSVVMALAAPAHGGAATGGRGLAAPRFFQHRHGDDQSGLVGQRHVRGADAELAAHLLATRREHHIRPSPVVLHDADIADPDAVSEAGAHRLDDCLLGGKARREKPLGPGGARQLRQFLRQQQVIDQPLAEARITFVHALGAQHIDADAKDHRAPGWRAPIINAFMARTAALRPSKTACATIAWPILSSTISAMAATAATLR